VPELSSAAKPLEAGLWRLAFDRAWRNTLHLWGLSMSALVLGGIVSALGIAFQWWDQGSPRTIASIVATVKAGVPGLLVAAAVFIGKFAQSADDILREIRHRVSLLEEAAEARAKSSADGERLVQLRHVGIKLAGKKVADGEEFNRWSQEVDIWQAEVLSIISGRVSAKELGEFQHVGTIPLKAFSWAKNPHHLKRLRKLDRQIQVLTEIMAKF